MCIQLYLIMCSSKLFILGIVKQRIYFILLRFHYYYKYFNVYGVTEINEGYTYNNTCSRRLHKAAPA